MEADLVQALKDWTDLSHEYAELDDIHKNYVAKLQEMQKLQKKCIAGVKHQCYRLNAIENFLGKVKPKNSDQKGEKQDLKTDILKRRAQLARMEEDLPKESGRYLRIILGDINVSILDTKLKFDYKDEYERFKLIVNVVGFVLATLCLCFNVRVLDFLLMFTTVWYYCTLTIRESILKVNGSRIRGWWRTHHFLSTFAAGVTLIWPEGECYEKFRNQLIWFSVYLTFVQYLQFTYQKGCLYRLKSLGERTNDMDITIDGFHSWMWKGLGFLLPFLFIGYFFQIYNAYTLYRISVDYEAPWQVTVLGMVLFIMGLGNVVTTSWTIPSKIRDRQMGLLKMRFTRLDKYFWRHKKRRESISQQNKPFYDVIEKILTRRGNYGDKSLVEDDEDSSLSDTEDAKTNEVYEKYAEQSSQGLIKQD